MQTENTPFSIVESRRLECQFGPHYYKERPQKSTRVKLQGSHKIGCHAHMHVKMCSLYVQYKITEREEDECTEASAVQNPGTVVTKVVYFVSLPTEEAHTGHPTGEGMGGFSQRMNEQVAAKIAELWQKASCTDKNQV